MRVNVLDRSIRSFFANSSILSLACLSFSPDPSKHRGLQTVLSLCDRFKRAQMQVQKARRLCRGTERNLARVHFADQPSQRVPYCNRIVQGGHLIQTSVTT